MPSLQLYFFMAHRNSAAFETPAIYSSSQLLNPGTLIRLDPFYRVEHSYKSWIFSRKCGSYNRPAIVETLLSEAMPRRWKPILFMNVSQQNFYTNRTYRILLRCWLFVNLLVYSTKLYLCVCNCVIFVFNYKFIT